LLILMATSSETCIFERSTGWSSGIWSSAIKGSDIIEASLAIGLELALEIHRVA
jgi:hypothetical protein